MFFYFEVELIYNVAANLWRRQWHPTPVLYSKVIQLKTYSDTFFLQILFHLSQDIQYRVKEESEKVGLKLNIQKSKIMAFGPITSWEIDGETVETVSDFIFLGSKTIADGDCSHEIKDAYSLEGKL